MGLRQSAEPPTPLVDAALAAPIIGTTEACALNKRFRQRHGIPWVQVGRSVRFDMADLVAWREARRIVPESGGAV